MPQHSNTGLVGNGNEQAAHNRPPPETAAIGHTSIY
jgi:hypothetical protein